MRIALANVPHPESLAASIDGATVALRDAAAAGAQILCFPECYLPGYRGGGHAPPRLDEATLEDAWQTIAKAAEAAHVAAIVGTERLVEGELRATALVIDRRGVRLGFQDKVQIDPSEEGTYAQGTDRAVFRIDELCFGICICHEGWRYPETVRWAARRGAQVVFHPHFHEAEGGFRPTSFADPANTFHEKAMLCRAAENTCYFASVNFASAGSPTTSAIVNPDGTLLAYQPYGVAGLLVADLDLSRATGLLASRCKP